MFACVRACIPASLCYCDLKAGLCVNTWSLAETIPTRFLLWAIRFGMSVSTQEPFKPVRSLYKKKKKVLMNQLQLARCTNGGRVSESLPRGFIIAPLSVGNITLLTPFIHFGFIHVLPYRCTK